MLASLSRAFLIGSIANCLAAPQPGRNLAEIEPRACSVLPNAIKDGGFENGLTSWNVTTTFTGAPGAPISCTVADEGYKSQHSAEMSGDSTPADDGNFLDLTQRFKICTNATYTLSWSLFQVKNTTQRAGSLPSLQVGLYPPSDHFSSYLIGDFRFGKNSYNASNYGAFGSEQTYTTGQAGVWNSYVATFPTTETGVWILDFSFGVVADQTDNCATTIRVDGVAVKPLDG